MIARRRKLWSQLIAAIVLVAVLLTACGSKAATAADKIELGQKYLTELNYTEAVAAFTEVIGLDPDNIEAYMGRAEAYKGLKQYDDAKADYTTAIEKTDEMPYTQAQAYTGRAEVYVLTEESSAAESDYTSAIGLLDQDNVGEKENVAADLITQLKIKVLQLHAEICMKLGWYDKALEDYARLEELGVDMSEDGASESSQQDESSVGGAYVWTYTDENGTIKELITVQSGSSHMSGVADYPPEQMSDMAASMIATQKWKEKHPETWKALFAIDPDGMSVEQMEALATIYDADFQEMEAEFDKWNAIDWKPQFIADILLSAPVSRVEKTADVLYIYVPTGTKLVTGQMTFTSYSGRAETIDMTDSLYGGINDPATPIYEWDTSSDANGSFRIEFREDK